MFEMKKTSARAKATRPPYSYTAVAMRPITTDGTTELTELSTIEGSTLNRKTGFESSIWKLTIIPDTVTHTRPSTAAATANRGSPSATFRPGHIAWKANHAHTAHSAVIALFSTNLSAVKYGVLFSRIILNSWMLMLPSIARIAEVPASNLMMHAIVTGSIITTMVVRRFMTDSDDAQSSETHTMADASGTSH